MTNRILFLIVALLSAFSLYAQQVKKVSGTVTDASTGETLIGVSVVEPGTANGTVTDIDGKYSLDVSGQTLTFSYVGYNKQTVNITKGGEINVQLSPNTELEAVVVIGYGTQRKSDLTGSIASISSKDVKNFAVPNVSQLMTGKAAGVYVAASSGQPGSNAVVRVRGFGTVNDNNPLYVVDGQPLDNINNINPSDIESIEVLKDASAAAIYGSRGSNGVILVTTKKGVAGQTAIALDAFVGIKSSYRGLKMANSEQFYNFMTEAYKNSGETLDPKFTKQYERGFDTDWWDAVTRNAFNQNYNLSIRKGSENMRTSFSLGYLDDQGAIITTKFNRISLKLNQEYDLNKHITVGTNIGIAKIRLQDAGALPNFNFIVRADPFTPVINPLVDPSSENYIYNRFAPTEWSFDPNPVGILKSTDRGTDSFNAFGNIFANIKLFKGISYRFQYSFERNNDVFKEFRPIFQSVFSEYNLANIEGKYRKETELTNNSAVVFNSVVEQQLNYNYSNDQHNFSAMLATTYESNDYQTINAFKRNGPGNDESFRVLDAQTAGAQTSGSRVKTSLLSYLGRINYVYKDTYLATVSFRADGSSKFAENNRWGYFPSFSLGWKVNNEEFFKNLDIENTVSSLKLRAGWGQNGNQRIPRDARLTLIGTNDEMQWYFGTGHTQGYVPVNMGNMDIRWETSQQTNIGIDMNLFRNHLDVSMDYFVKKTSDMLLQVPVPSLAGYPNSTWMNAGDVQNKGFEMIVNYRNEIGDFGYNVGANISTYKTEITNLASDIDFYLTGDVSRTYVGGPMARFFGYKQVGIFQNQQEIDNYQLNGVKIQPNAKPGDFKFADLNGDGVINDKDRDFIGDPNPDLIYGFNINLNYKNFDLGMFFQGTLGNDIWNANKGVFASAGRKNILAEAYTNAWFKEGDNATYPRITNSDSNDNFRGSSFYVENGSFLRLQNIQLGYTLPRSLAEKTKLFSSCRIYASGQNLFTFTKYTGLDPEVGVDNAMNLGVDQSRYPSSRTVLFGVNLQF